MTSRPRAVPHEYAVGLARASADAAAQLVQLRKAKDLGVLYYHKIGVGDVDADLDDRRRDQNVEQPGGKIRHDTGFFLGRKAAVHDADAQ